MCIQHRMAVRPMGSYPCFEALEDAVQVEIERKDTFSVNKVRLFKSNAFQSGRIC